MLEKIKTENKKEELQKILRNPSADHSERLYLAGFLKYAGYTESEIRSIIHSENCWSDYSSKITSKQVSWIYGNKKQSSQIIGEDFLSPEEVKVPDYLDSWNKSLFLGAVFTAWEYGPGEYNRTIMNWNHLEHPIFRSVEGTNNWLLVLDIDREGNLEAAYNSAKKIIIGNKIRFDYIKYSGSKGFHLIKRIPKPMTLEKLKEMASKLSLGEEFDTKMFNPNWLVRGYCLNLKSGYYSVPCNPLKESLKEIQKRSRLGKEFLN